MINEVKVNLPDSYFLPQDDEEAKIIADIENGEYKSRSMYLPVSQDDFLLFVGKAKSLGISYQDLMKKIIADISSGKIQLEG